MRDGSRKTAQITEVVGMKDGEIILNPIFEFREDMEKTKIDKVVGRLERTENELVHPEKFIAKGVYKYL